MKKIFRTLALVLGLVVGSHAKAGIPVLDAANLANSVQQVIAWGQQYQQMVQSLTELRNQYVQLQNTYNSLTGSRGLVTLLNAAGDQAARRYLPEQAAELEQLTGAVMAGYGPLQSAIRDTRALVSSMPAGTFGDGTVALNALQARINSLATQKAFGQAAYTAASRRFQDIENLIAISGGANDPKAIAEMQTRIAAQQALLQNESAKLQAMTYMQAAEQQVNEQRGNEAVGRWGKTTLPPVAF